MIKRCSVFGLTAGVLLLANAAPAAAQGVTARLAPEASAFQWSPSLGMGDDNFYGASASLGFGRYVFLKGSYLTASGMPTALASSGFTGVGVGALENTLDASMISTDVQLRLGAGQVAPVIMGGGGILELTPTGRDGLRQIFANYGGGIDMRLLPWLDGQVLLKEYRFRLDRSSIAGATADGVQSVDMERADLKSSFAFSASLGARLGGGRPSTRADQLDDDVRGALAGGEGLIVPVEVMAGVIRFSEASRIGDQSLGGVRAGFDFGPYFGLRGSYSEGYSSGSLGGMSAWSGEAQFNVGAVTGLSPHLLVGYGGLNFWEGFENEDSVRPRSESALILGAGVGIPIGRRTRFVASVRDYITSTASGSDLDTPSDLRHNIGLNAGLSFIVRGSQAAAPSVDPRPAIPVVAGRTTAPIPAADSVPATAARPGVVTPVAADSVAADSVRVHSTPTSFQSERMLTIPIPTQGEIILRYGPPVDPAVGATGAVADTAAGRAVTVGELAQMEARITARIAELLAARATVDSSARPQDDQELRELANRVDELTRAVRSGAGGPIVVSPVVVESNSSSESGSFFKGADFLMGPKAVRNGRLGFGADVRVRLSSMMGDRLQPYLGFHLSRARVKGEFAGEAYQGSVSSRGVEGGVSMALPAYRAIMPEVSFGIAGLNGTVSGETPDEDELVNNVYGGFVMGPRISLSATWQRKIESSWAWLGSLSNTWAGARGGWAGQVGMRWTRPTSR